MKYILLVCTFTLSSMALAQQPFIEYYNQEGRKTTKGSAYYYEVGKKLDRSYFGEITEYYSKDSVTKKVSFYINGRPNGTQTEYYENGNPKREINYIDGVKKGKYITWYKSGIKEEEREYIELSESFDYERELSYLLINRWDTTGEHQVKEGEGYFYKVRSEEQIKDGIFNLLTEENYREIGGYLKGGKRVGVWKGSDNYNNPFEETYSDGTLQQGNLSKTNGAVITYDKLFEMSEPRKGMQSFYQYIGKNMKYPNDARKNGSEGRVFVQFVVDEDGALTEVRTIKGFHPSCDSEAERVINEAKKWNPGRLRGVPVKLRMILPITFRLR